VVPLFDIDAGGSDYREIQRGFLIVRRGKLHACSSLFLKHDPAMVETVHPEGCFHCLMVAGQLVSAGFDGDLLHMYPPGAATEPTDTLFGFGNFSPITPLSILGGRGR
jgi:hypothetical protein